MGDSGWIYMIINVLAAALFDLFKLALMCEKTGVSDTFIFLRLESCPAISPSVLCSGMPGKYKSIP